jgi:hypothetical protein
MALGGRRVGDTPAADLFLVGASGPLAASSGFAVGPTSSALRP